MGLYAGQIISKITEYVSKGAEYWNNRQIIPDKNPDKNEVELQAMASGFLNRENSLLIDTVEGSRKLAISTRQWLHDLNGKYTQILSGTRVFNEKSTQYYENIRGELVSLKAKEKSLLKELEDFKNEHAVEKIPTMTVDAGNSNRRYSKGKYGIEGIAKYPEARLSPYRLVSTISPFALPLFFLVAETLLGMWLFRGEGGLLEGAIIAMFFSVLNISPAFLSGLIFRYKNHKKELARYGGWLVFLIFAPISLYLNNLIAILRYRYQEQLESLRYLTENALPPSLTEMSNLFISARHEAWKIFYFSLPEFDIKSFFLLIIGLLFASLSFYKGYKYDDPYPGYGTRDRRYKKAAMEFTRASEVIRIKIFRFLDEQRSQFEKLQDKLLLHSENINGHINRTNNALKDFHETGQKIVDDFEIVLDAYRNAKMAGNAKAPSSFPAGMFQLTPDYSKAAENLLEELRLLKDNFYSLIGQVSHMIDELTQSINRFLKFDFLVFLKEIDDEAEKIADDFYKH